MENQHGEDRNVVDLRGYSQFTMVGDDERMAFSRIERGIRCYAVTVYFFLASHLNRSTSACFPSAETLCEETGLSVKTIKVGIDALVKSGHIERKARFKPNGMRMSNMYFLLSVKEPQASTVSGGGIHREWTGASTEGGDNQMKVEPDEIEPRSLSSLSSPHVHSPATPADIKFAPDGSIIIGEPEQPKVTVKPPEYTSRFEQAWEAYGRKGLKKKAFDAWKKDAAYIPLGDMFLAIANYKSSKRGSEYPQDFSTWLNGRGWETDWVASEATQSNGRVIDEHGVSRPRLVY